MGYGTYSSTSRALRSDSLGYTTKHVDEIFTQNRERKMHKDMDPKGVKLRESCDSPTHPLTTPIQLYLDVTGSMGSIPHELIKEGLPTLVGKLIQNGVLDVALMFGAVGDHECDRAPLQIGQFESGDAELDMWLTRTWLEGNGGGNAGESYLLAWYFSAFHTRTDAFDKRKKKGFVFTVGDEPCLTHLPLSAIKSIMGDTAVGQGTYTREDLLKAAQEKNHVYHIHFSHGYPRDMDGAWKDMLGQNLLVVDDHAKLVKTISDIVLSHQGVHTTTSAPTKTTDTTTPTKIVL
jgi:hypothetical protein